MDLIYTNSSMEDVGVLLDYDLDMAFGSDENDFEITISKETHCCEEGSLIYIEGTEYGGIVDSIESDSSTNEVIYSGRSFHGILDSKVIRPDSGQDYLYLTGEANAVIRTLITRLNLSALFEGATESSGLTFNSYQVPRYISAYKGIRKALKSIGAKLKIEWTGSKILLSAESIHDYSNDEEFDADLVTFQAKKNYKPVNHLICLGSGDLAARLVVDLYVDTSGNISQTQTITGIDEVTEIYEYSQISDESELITKGTNHLKEGSVSDEIDISFNSNDDSFDIGDIIGTYDNITGISVSSDITKKIITIQNGKISISYKVGE